MEGVEDAIMELIDRPEDDDSADYSLDTAMPDLW